MKSITITDIEVQFDYYPGMGSSEAQVEKILDRINECLQRDSALLNGAQLLHSDWSFCDS
jgi:hypothetical protein